MKLTISLGQMNVALGHQAENFAKVRDFAAEAAARKSQLVLFPELWSTGYNLAQTASMAAPFDQGPFAHLADLARAHSIHIYGSCLGCSAPDRKFNTASLFGPDGTALAYYNKIHLFRLLDEDRYLTPGSRPVLAETPWGKTGLAICYDLRFPELFRAYTLAGARAILLVAAWPEPRLHHWQILLRARAIENQLFVIACNRVGVSEGARYFGHSCVVDPWGRTIVETTDEETLTTVEIDLAMVDEVRAKIPVLEDRRPDAYAEL
jgi:omega-amidase